MTSTIAQTLLSATAIAGLLSTTCAQTTVSMVADKDATLIEHPTGGLANDAGQGIFCGRVGLNSGETIRRALVHFDVAGNVPAGAKVISAQLDMWAAQSSAFFPIATDAHRLTTDWNEGPTVASGQGGSGSPATTGDTTWLHADFPGAFWNNPGGDFDPMPSFSFDMPGIGFIVASPTTRMLADVQGWLDAPAGNFGWLLKTDEMFGSTARRISSREASTTPQLPTLTVTYLLPGETASYGTGWPVGAGTFDFAISGPATGGTTISFDLNNAPAPSIGAYLISLELDPAGTPLLPGCNVYLPIGGLIIPGDAFVVPASGIVSTPFFVPNAPGFLLNVQAAVIDMNPLSFSLSNAGLMVTN